MPMLASDTRSELRSLVEAQTRHHQLDSRLKQLGRTAYPTPTEQREMAELKKHKLLVKDEIARLKGS